MEGGGFGLIGDFLVGLVGAFIGDWLLPRLGIHLGVAIVALILNAFIGAVVLLLILRLVGGGWAAHGAEAGACSRRLGVSYLDRGDLGGTARGIASWMGLMAYWITGKTSELFPGPNGC